MRFEGKHTYFKNLAHRMNCFKNVCKTLAVDRVCYSGNYPLIDKPTCGPGEYNNCCSVCGISLILILEIRKSLVMLKYGSLLRQYSENDVVIWSVFWLI